MSAAVLAMAIVAEVEYVERAAELLKLKNHFSIKNFKQFERKLTDIYCKVYKLIGGAANWPYTTHQHHPLPPFQQPGQY